jgi:pimeloyl-ACP methyl ester carboxylesterase
VTKRIFLPGAGASAHFWRPVADRLGLDGELHFFSWPGLGNEPPDPRIQSLDDAAEMVLSHMTEPVDLLAQSMGGLIGLKAAVKAPRRVRRLVLTATSGGIPMDDLGCADWRSAYRAEFPNAAPWITEIREDLSGQLGQIHAPALLLWGDQDEITPIAVGERLCALLPNARLKVVPGGDHDFVRTHAAQIAPMISDHLA